MKYGFHSDVRPFLLLEFDMRINTELIFIFKENVSMFLVKLINIVMSVIAFVIGMINVFFWLIPVVSEHGASSSTPWGMKMPVFMLLAIPVITIGAFISRIRIHSQTIWHKALVLVLVINVLLIGGNYILNRVRSNHIVAIGQRNEDFRNAPISFAQVRKRENGGSFSATNKERPSFSITNKLSQSIYFYSTQLPDAEGLVHAEKVVYYHDGKSKNTRKEYVGPDASNPHMYVELKPGEEKQFFIDIAKNFKTVQPNSYLDIIVTYRVGSLENTSFHQTEGWVYIGN